MLSILLIDWARIGQSLLLGLESTLIGVAVVFVVLGILVVSIKLMNRVKTTPVEVNEELTTAPALTGEVDASIENSGATIAAIVAAINMYYESNGQTGVKFVVRRISQIK